VGDAPPVVVVTAAGIVHVGFELERRLGDLDELQVAEL